MPAPHARATPALPDELIEEVLLRMPPDDPASLARAAVACRRWCGLVADPAFRRRRLELHRGTPAPMLGVLCDGIWATGSVGHPSARFVPTSTCRPPWPRADGLRRGLRSVDARHGRVLLHSSAASGGRFIVWDPITDRRVELPSPLFYLGKRSRKATVLCAATGGVCDHRNCHRGPFIVVLVGISYIAVRNPEVEAFNMLSCIYSSESDAWSKPTYYDHRGDDLATMRSALVGNTLFFTLRNYDRILNYDLGRQQMSRMRLPRVRTGTSMVFTNFVPELTTLGDGRLGFARVEKYSELCLWSKGEGDDVKGWTLCKVIDLKDLFRPLVDSSFDLFYYLVGFAESVCVAFVAVQGGLFAIDMKSGLMKKVCEGRGICCAVPSINFCNPALEAPSRDDGQRVGVSSGKGRRLKRLKS